MEIISRKQAKEQNLSKYFTGKPCKNGHVSEKYTSTGACVVCQKNYIDDNREKHNDNVKKYYNNNREKILKDKKEKYNQKK